MKAPGPTRRGHRIFAWALLPVLVLAACGGPVTTSPGATDNPTPSLTPVPGAKDPTEAPTLGATVAPTDDPGAAFSPPDPLCPAPAAAVEAPRLLASVGSQSALMNAGSTSVVTCSTTGASDAIPVDPTNPLHLVAGEMIHVALSPGWHFLYWDSWNRPAGVEGANVTPGGRTPDRPISIDVPAPNRTGSSILGVVAWTISSDGRTVSGIEGTVLVDR